MTDRITFRPAQTGDFEFCQRLYLEGIGWITERLQLDIKRQYKSFANPRGRSQRRGHVADGPSCFLITRRSPISARITAWPSAKFAARDGYQDTPHELVEAKTKDCWQRPCARPPTQGHQSDGSAEGSLAPDAEPEPKKAAKYQSGRLFQIVRFAADSPLEGSGFEPSVPLA
jgi:hypothetical protein